MNVIKANGTLWLRHDFIKATLGVADGYLRKRRCEYRQAVGVPVETAVMPALNRAWRWLYQAGHFFYAYENIPDKKPVCFKTKLPSQEELLKQIVAPEISIKKTTPKFAPHTRDVEKYIDQCLENSKDYAKTYKDATGKTWLCQAAAVFDGIVNFIRESGQKLKQSSFIQSCASVIKNKGLQYLPKSAGRLWEKVKKAFTPEAAKEPIIASPRAGNKNAVKGFDEAEILSWILQLKHMGRNFTAAFIIRKIKDMCAKIGGKAPCERWLGERIAAVHTQYLTAIKNYGENHRAAKLHKSYIPFKNALHAGDCWQIDGTRFNFIPHDQTKFLYIVAVRDVSSGDIVGWSYGLQEDRWLVSSALKNAVQNAGYLPYQMTFDKFPGHNTEEMKTLFDMFENHGVKVTLTSVAQAKSGIERFFGTLQTVFMSASDYYYGEGVKSTRKHAHRSEEWRKKAIAEAKKSGFNFTDACAEADKVINAYRTTVYSKWSRKHRNLDLSPAQLHDGCEKPNVTKLDAEEINFLFGLRKEVAIDGKGMIKTEIAKMEHFYQVADAKIIGHYAKALLVYDVEDLTSVGIYEIPKSSATVMFRYLGRAAEIVPIQIYGPNAEWGKMAKLKQYHKQINEAREAEAQALIATGTSDITAEVGYRSVANSAVNPIALIYPTSSAKHSHEAIETAYLTNEFGIKSPPPPDDDYLPDLLNTI
jgi:hypothetical protein